MNTHIILNHNSRVKVEDTVFFLGDFCFRNSSGGKAGEGSIHKADYYRKQLNGLMVFVKGNHDRNNSLKTNIERVIIRYGGEQICLVHNPMHVDYSYTLNFCGHVHGTWKFKRMRHYEQFTDVINVGVDVWGFKPVTFEEIMKEYRQWKKLEEKKSDDQKNPIYQDFQKKNEENGSAKI